MPRRDLGRTLEGSPAQMFLVQDLLRLNQFRVKLRKRHLGRHHGVLNIKQTVIPRVELAGFRDPALGAGGRSVDADVHDFRNVQTPLPNGLEPFPIPIRIGDEINGDGDPKGSCKFERLEVSAQRDALAMHLRPSASISSTPKNIYWSPSVFQNWKTSLLRNKTSPRVSM